MLLFVCSTPFLQHLSRFNQVPIRLFTTWVVAQSLPQHLALLTHLELDRLLDLEEVLVPAQALELDLLQKDQKHKCVIGIAQGVEVVSKVVLVVLALGEGGDSTFQNPVCYL
jgi:hypothetical protein